MISCRSFLGLALSAALLAGCHRRAAQARDAGLPDAGPADAGADAGPPPLCLPSFGTGAPAPGDAGCPSRPQTPDLLDRALAGAGLDRCSLAFPSNWRQSLGTAASDPFRLPYFDALHDVPLRAPAFAKALATDLDLASASPRPVSQLIAVAQARLGSPIQACDPGLGDRADPSDALPFARAVEALIQRAGQPPDQAGIESQAQSMPIDLQRALAPLVGVLAGAGDARAQLLGSHADLSDLLAGVPFLAAPGYPPDVTDPRIYNALDEIDLAPLSTYAARLAMAIESADLERFRGTMGFSFTAQTPLGTIAVRDASANTYLPTDPGFDGNVLLLVDTGGDDVYRIPVGGTVDNQPAAVAIDLGGDDQYLYQEVPDPNDGSRLPSDGAGRYSPRNPPAQDYGPISLSVTARQGGAVLGVGMLFDLGGGRDHYRSLRLSQGFGALGIGVLYDDGGDDLFEGEALVQGAGVFGIGILLDAGGDDVRRTYYASQGFGYTRGVGLLVDRAGNDRYLADVGDPSQGGDPLYFTPQLPGKGNSSFVQGAGFGRLDATHGIDMSGGLGVLRDLDGDDQYQGSVFVQATAYWFGIGLLLDARGNDQYDGLWYAQGTAAHAGLAVLLDEAGDDRYQQTLAPAATTQAVGHDFGVAFLIDLAGDDQLRGAGLCLGDGNDNGAGFLLDEGGADAFEGRSTGSFGGATRDAPERAGMPTYGFFVKAGAGADGGADTYLVDGAPVDRAGTAWSSRQDPDAGAEHGVGIDQPDGSVEPFGD